MEEKTNYAPGLRSTKDEILDEKEFVATQKFFKEIFGSIAGIGAVIDKNRQIVYANDDFLNLLGVKTLEPILGKRPGEVVSCVHNDEGPSGCGTSVNCGYCGAVNAIIESQETGQKSMKETRISSVIDGKNKSWDLKITSAPVTLSGKLFYLLFLQDISDEKRRLALERSFFHDLLNSAGGLNGLLTILKEGSDPDEERDIINLSEEASRDIIEEIMMHRQLSAAESGDLQVNIEDVSSRELLISSTGKISSHEVGKDKKVLIDEFPADIVFETDRNLLQRVLINLLKNALEATPKDGTVFIGADVYNEKIRFWVKNDQVIPMDIQMQLFQRSFSTKGQNRGIGTYSIRLLTENYLNGKVSFKSNEEERTVFSIELNRIWSGS